MLMHFRGVGNLLLDLAFVTEPDSQVGGGNAAEVVLLIFEYLEVEFWLYIGSLMTFSIFELN